MQIVCKATLDQFQNALGLNRRRNDLAERSCLIRHNCSEPSAIVQRVGEEFNRIYPRPTTVSTSQQALARLERNLQRHREDLARFYENNCKVRLCYEDGGKAVGGYVVLNGELLGFHNIRHGVGDWMVRQAISDGAERLDVYAGHAERLYHKWGFREVTREDNDVKGGPDVVWMRLGFGTKPQGRNSGPN